MLNRDLAERRICRRENQKCKKHRKQKLKSISKHLKRLQSAFSTTELFLIVSTVCRRRNAAKVICEADCDSGVQRRQSCRVNAGVRPPARSQAEQCRDLVFPRIGSVRPGSFHVRHAQAASLGVIILCCWPWRSLAASETKKANRNAVKVRRREERSDEMSTKLPAIAANISMPVPRVLHGEPEW